MTNSLILVKFMQRLDKASSSDYGNLEQWMLIEAFNKGQSAWIRRQLEGINQTRTGAEGSTRRIDDLQFILTTQPILMTTNQTYWVGQVPGNYLEWCRISAQGINSCCPARNLIIFESIEADLDINLNDIGKQPNWDWATTFATLSSKYIKIYTNGLFDIVNPTLTYYRSPVDIQVAEVANPQTGTISTVDVPCEAADSVIELIIDEGVAILANDLQYYQRGQISSQRAERDN